MKSSPVLVAAAPARGGAWRSRARLAIALDLLAHALGHRREDLLGDLLARARGLAADLRRGCGCTCRSRSAAACGASTSCTSRTSAAASRTGSAGRCCGSASASDRAACARRRCGCARAAASGCRGSTARRAPSGDRASCRRSRGAPRCRPFPASGWPDFDATSREDSSFCYSVGGPFVSVLYFLLLVGVLVVIHELGHFVAAKLLDVKVLRFSFGYGRPLVRVTLGETEYQIGVFPLGGYVRILGIEGAPTSAEQGRRRAAASRAARCGSALVIVFAGPAANLVLPVDHLLRVLRRPHDAAGGGDRRRARRRRRRARRASSPAIACSRSTAARCATGRRSRSAVRASPGKELQLRIVAQRQGVRALPHADRGDRAPARWPASSCRAASASRTRRSCRSSA